MFLDYPDEVRRTAGYIERDPLPLGLPVQQRPFVTLSDNWPLHAGRSPDSAHARRLHEHGRYV